MIPSFIIVKPDENGEEQLVATSSIQRVVLERSEGPRRRWRVILRTPDRAIVAFVGEPSGLGDEEGWSDAHDAFQAFEVLLGAVSMIGVYTDGETLLNQARLLVAKGAT